MQTFNIFNPFLNYICIWLNSYRVGNVLTIPASVLTDWILKGFILSWQSFLGVAIIIVGFLGMVVSDFWELRMKEVEEVEEADERTDLLSNAEESNISSTSGHQKINFRSKLFDFLI